MCCHFHLFNFPLHSLVRRGKYRNQHPLSFFFLYCYVTQPITHMKTQEISKDLYENPFCTFSRKELEKVTLWHLSGWAGGGGAYSCLVCSVSVNSMKGLSTRTGLMLVYSFSSCFFFLCLHTALARNPFPHLVSISFLETISLPHFFQVHIWEIIPWGRHDPSLDTALLCFTRDSSWWDLPMGLHQLWYLIPVKSTKF